MDERTTWSFAAVAAVEMHVDTDFDTAVGEDDIEAMERFAERAAGWKGALLVVVAAAVPADGGEAEQVGWNLLVWKPEAVAVAVVADDGDWMEHVQGADYVVDVELEEDAAVGCVEETVETVSNDLEVVVHEQGVAQGTNKDLSDCAEIFGKNSEDEGVSVGAEHTPGTHTLNGLSPA